jgi:hypothetical protein
MDIPAVNVKQGRAFRWKSAVRPMETGHDLISAEPLAAESAGLI